jgi:uncharacterized protein YceK
VRIAKAVTANLVQILLSAALTGCATYRTISEVEPGGPMVFSGTRLDIEAISGDDIGIRKFKATPPPYPLLDLPFSVVADTAIFPLAFSVATYEFVFGR